MSVSKPNKVKIILNPYSGNLPGRVKAAQIEQALRQVGLDYHLELTVRRGHGIELARQAALEGCPLVVAAGGDGTINEVANGLMQAAGETEARILGIIPLGTGNDLAMMLQLPSDITAACQRLANGQPRRIDVGQVNDRYFVNNSAVGLESVITIAYEKLRWLRGSSRYIMAALQSIMSAKPWLVRLTWGDNLYNGPIALVSVGNSRRTGGNFYLTPDAVVDDGLLDFVYAGKLNRLEILRLLFQTLNGAHLHHPQVVCRKTTTLSITAFSPTPIQADGEIIAERATEIIYRVLPGRLKVIV